MMWHKSLCAAAFVLLLATPAWAQSWSTAEAGTDDSCIVTPPNPANQKTCFYNLAQADTTNSPGLKTEECRFLTLHVDTNMSATTSGGEVTLYGCVSSTVSTNVCNPMYTDAGAVTLNGDGSVGRAASYGGSAPWVFLVVSANATGALRASITCY
jgi:hypothetical protein